MVEETSSFQPRFILEGGRAKTSNPKPKKRTQRTVDHHVRQATMTMITGEKPTNGIHSLEELEQWVWTHGRGGLDGFRQGVNNDLQDMHPMPQWIVEAFGGGRNGLIFETAGRGKWELYLTEYTSRGGIERLSIRKVY